MCSVQCTHVCTPRLWNLTRRSWHFPTKTVHCLIRLPINQLPWMSMNDFLSGKLTMHCPATRWVCPGWGRLPKTSSTHIIAACCGGSICYTTLLSVDHNMQNPLLLSTVLPKHFFFTYALKILSWDGLMRLHLIYNRKIMKFRRTRSFCQTFQTFCSSRQLS